MLAAGRRGDRSEIREKKCDGCGKLAVGPAVSASDNVLVNGRPSVRVHDTGAHTEGSPDGAWEAVEGAPAVLINSRNAHRLGDGDKHRSGKGALMEGSPNVLIGNRVLGGAPATPGSEAHGFEGGFHLLDDDGAPLANVPYVIRSASGQEHRGRTSGHGHTALVFTEKEEELELEILDDDDDHLCGS